MKKEGHTTDATEERTIEDQQIFTTVALESLTTI
jgi:hypothetical protein